ncbi:MAG: MarR family transcriptional regulator [Armatimonadetes bacterium]|nr:MarR family transcriptional regulator [Armatimonadota bacterium]
MPVDSPAQLRLKMALSDELLARAERAAAIFIRAIYHTMGERALETLSHTDITYSQLQALRFLGSHASATVGDLAEGLHISYPSATNMINRLEKKGYVGREEMPEDRRQVGLRLTDSGAELLAKLDQDRRKQFATILARMDDADRESFLHGLNVFIEAGIQGGLLPADRLCLHCGSDSDPCCPIALTQPDEFCR